MSPNTMARMVITEELFGAGYQARFQPLVLSEDSRSYLVTNPVGRDVFGAGSEERRKVMLGPPKVYTACLPTTGTPDLRISGQINTMRWVRCCDLRWLTRARMMGLMNCSLRQVYITIIACVDTGGQPLDMGRLFKFIVLFFNLIIGT